MECVQCLLDNGADVNHVSSNGRTALLVAAQSGLIDLVGFLLAKGAHVDTRDLNIRSVFRGQTAFARLATSDDDIVGRDETLLRLLTEYVFDASKPYPDRQRSVIENGDDLGRTLLHHCAGRGLVNCVEALLRKGASVNALFRRSKFTKKGDRNMKETWFQTPLDFVEEARSFHETVMRKRPSYDKNDFALLQGRWTRVVEILEQNNGIYSTEERLLEPWDQGPQNLHT
ncbi:ankyrin [Karstenula rhodostoma CBS 690.94]|uniref:Ankyrin n=1 Tax=Karstenula rhodostoma CBS 690.94 TaxID=1392251 RepID=A0A9P4PR00_9PLEO|nr:ankyrin [Karstenula rhodostoma CBS 690.94]